MKRILLVIMGWFLALHLGWGQGYWEKIPGPNGGEFSLKRASNGTVFAFNTAFIGSYYYSQDDGNTWHPVINPYLGGDSTAYYAGWVEMGMKGNLYKTVTNWDGANSTSEIYRSQDFGQSWQLINPAAPLVQVTETPTGTLLGLDAADGIQRSTDDGQNWTYAGNYSGLEISFHFHPNGFITIGSDRYSQDDGATWQTILSPGISASITVSSSGVFFSNASVDTRVLRSANQGQSWVAIVVDPSIGLGGGSRVNGVVELPSGRLILSLGQVLYYSDDIGLHWDKLDCPVSSLRLESQAVFPNGTIMAYTHDAIYRSPDGGEHWQFSATGMEKSTFLRMQFLSEDTVFALTKNGLWRSYGSGWTKLTDNQQDPYSIPLWDASFTLTQQGQVLVKQDSVLLWSTDFGNTFSNITPIGFAPKGIAMSPSGTLFTQSVQGLVRSTDHGQSWLSVSGMPGFSQMFFHPSGRIFGLFTDAPNDDLWRSDDDGLSWQNTFLLSGSNALLWSLNIKPDGTIYAYGDYDSGIFKSIDNGENWIFIQGPDDLDFYERLFITTQGHLILPEYSRIRRSVNEGVTWQTLPDLWSLGNMEGFALSPGDHFYIGVDGNGIFRTVHSISEGAYLEGSVLRDADAECSTPDAQAPLKNWTLKADGLFDFYTQTDPEGHYVFFLDIGAYQISPRIPQNLWWSLCDSSQTIHLPTIGATDTANFTALALANCPLLSVDLAAPQLRRCFNNPVYLHYCNQGTETADSAYIDVILDPYLSLISAELPASKIDDHTYRFQLGGLSSGDCGQFSLEVYVSCDSTVIGQTHCISAHAWPDTLCSPVPGWSGANIVAEASCQDTVVRLSVRNTGHVPSQDLGFIVIEDDIVLMQGHNTYGADQAQGEVYEVPADGHTWRIESEQEPGHPFSNIALAFTEGCGGFSSLGFINQFPVNGIQPSWDTECRENTGSYDPNDKQGFPLGFSQEHRIRPGQPLDYMIRFQNTGTDTAFTVVLRDTLSPWLDPASIRPGAASHPYSWALEGPGVVAFTFDHIALPDSNTNAAGSQGFISFRLNQQPGVPLEAQIFNRAAIYFDFNAPVLTNRTLHTVGEDYLTTLQERPNSASKALGKVSVSPNPMETATTFRLRQGAFRNHKLIVSNALGFTVREERLSGGSFVCERKGLPGGVYFWKVEDAGGRLVEGGKLLLR